MAACRGRSGEFTIPVGEMKPLEDDALDGVFSELVITAVMIEGQRHELSEPIPVSRLARMQEDERKCAIIQFGDVIIDG